MRAQKTVAEAASRIGARVVHISAIGADANSSSRYARTKGRGRAGRAGRLSLRDLIMRPSVVFGPEDQFTNRFAALARIAPALPLIGGGVTKLQPVYVGDVATAIADAVDGKTRQGAIYELGGPEVMTLREIIELILQTIERERVLVPLPFALAHLKAMFLQFAPGDLKLTPDQVELLRADNVVSDAAKSAGLTLEGLGEPLESMAAVIPSYLWRFRKTGQFAHKGA